ncbi:hypothetical protein CR513_49320, partial [Mucuna pruriens]
MGIASTEVEQGVSKPSRATLMVAKVLIKGGYQPRKGLGKCLKGITESSNTGGRPEGKIQRTPRQGQPEIMPDLYQRFISRGMKAWRLMLWSKWKE